MGKKLQWHWSGSEETWWGQPYPIFNIYKSGKKYVLVYIRGPKSKPRYIEQLKSIHQAKMIANKMVE